MNPNYQCPICQQLLVLSNKSFKCTNNHSFDLAKENYVNLLPVQFKHSKNPGDNKAMVNARRNFLEQNYYQPLVNLLTRWYREYTNCDGNFLDAGCGEGYYTHQHKADNNGVYGVDIAKEAIKKAAKKYQDCHFSVGTLSKLPFENNHFNWILSVYAPILEEEFTRVLTDNGYLITVTPAKNHLYELKERIYQKAEQHDEQRQPIVHLELVREENLNYEMQLSTGDDCLNLLSMTPFAFKADENTKQWLAKQSDFKCQADFLIRLYKKLT